MSDAQDQNRPIWIGLAAFVGTFLVIPIWDLYALIYTLRTGMQARRSTGSEAGLAITLQPVRRIIFLLLAYAVALFGATAFRGVVTQPGPFGFVATGVRNYRDLVGDPACCEMSSVLGVAVSDLLAQRLPNTLRLLAAISVAGMLLAALLMTVALLVHRLSQRREGLGAVVYSLLRLGAVRVMAAPLAGVALVAVLFVAIRFQLLPYGGITSLRAADAGSLTDLVRHLILPSFVGALLPALLAAQAGVRGWTGWEERTGRRDSSRWVMLGTEAARAFYDQAGWIVGSLLLIESLLAYPGIGALLLDSIVGQDAAVLVGTLSLLPLWLLIARLRSALTASFQRAWLFINPAPTTPRTPASQRAVASHPHPRPLDRIWLGVAVVLFLVPLVSIMRGLIASPHDPQASNPQAVYEPPSPDHPLGTDQLGRDVQSRIYQAQRVTLGIALSAGLVALVFGGLWGGLSTLLTGWRGQAGEWLADLIRLPAEAAMLLHPALVVMAFTVSFYSITFVTRAGQSLTMVGWAIGLALTPRMAWAVETLWAAAPPGRTLRWRLGGTMIILFAAAVFVAFQYSVAIDLIGLGVQAPTASLGNMLTGWQEILGGTAAVNDARFYLLGTNLGAAAGVPAMALYLLSDALTDFFGFQRKGFLPRLLG